MFVWIENTALALWVSTSLWAYPFLLSLHILGLAVVAGIFLLRDLHLIGLIGALPPSNFFDLRGLAYAGFTLNAISGFLLFSSQASILVGNISFLLKISFLSIAMALAVSIHKQIDKGGNITQPKISAFISLTCWFGTITAGRLIAYIF